MQGYFAINQPVLPPAWQLSYPQTGQPYYMDNSAKTTQWAPTDAGGYSFGPYYSPVMVAAPGRGAGRGRGGRRGIDQGKRKTKLCIYWEKNGNCSWGDRCAFAHGDNEIRTSSNLEPSQPQQQPCDGGSQTA